MGYIKSFSEYVSSVPLNEANYVQKKIEGIARHLAFDKDVIEYLNTSRGKRTIGWRDLLGDKLRGKDENYITYITKNMVMGLNPKEITGPVSIKIDSVANGSGDEVDLNVHGNGLNDIINNIHDRLKDIEDTLGITSGDEESLDASMRKAKELGFDVVDGDDNDAHDTHDATTGDENEEE